MKRILMIDDDPSLSERLIEYFALYDIKLIAHETPSAGMQCLKQDSPELILLDVMLPEKDGFTLCKEIKATCDIPIIMLTARGELSDKVLGLELGADDYLPKPFEPRELIARINALLRRNKTQQIDKQVWQFQGLNIYPDHHKVTLDGEEIIMTGMEFRLLCLLAKNPGQIFNRDDILNQLKGIDADVYTRSIDILLSRLRNRLGENAQNPKYIKTIRNMGYCFLGKKL